MMFLPEVIRDLDAPCKPLQQNTSTEGDGNEPASNRPAPAADSASVSPSEVSASPFDVLPDVNAVFTEPMELYATEARQEMLFAGAMPKEETGALRLLNKHPTYDGRGCVVAVFDTGVDPAAAGLQRTTDGKPKVIDIVDGTGSGDVDTSTVVRADGDDPTVLTGLYGKKLVVNADWVNPSGRWHVGAKDLFSLYPPQCKRRVAAKRKELWEEKQRTALAAAVGALAAFKPDGLAAEERAAAKGDLEARVALLKEHADKYEDDGPLIHCVVWHDGSVWRAALDTSELFPDNPEEGRLAAFVPMTNYRLERQYATFSALDACNFAVNIYDEGATLSIVTDTGAHGTHVAGITAAHHPDEPALNGVAPGAQVVSCKIGDTRLGGMESGPGLVRALVAALENGADVINMSYGEPTTTPDYGRFIQLAEEVVNKHGVIFVSSAGNSGPGLTTVGAPGGTTSCIYSIAAYVSPALAASGHSVRSEVHPEGWAGQQYNWSSRGPTADGDIGVAFCAPGGAIAPVPQSTQQSRQLMNGTSMSSPNACGNVLLLLSALKQEGLAISPARLRRAIENTCSPVTDDPTATLTYGRGLIQVDKAWEYLQKSEVVDKPCVRYVVSCRRSDSQVRMRGIYQRDAADFAHPTAYSVSIQPTLHSDADIREQMLSVEDRLVLRATAPWLSCPARLLLPHNGRDFEVLVDAVDLEPGLHYAEVQAFDSSAEWRGPLARLPVTLCKPHVLSPDAPQNGVRTPSMHTMLLGPLSFRAGQEHRFFAQVPAGATWAEMTVRCGVHENPKLFMIHATQLFPQERPIQSRSSVLLDSEATVCTTFRVTGGRGLELVLAQFWNSTGHAQLDVELQFYGLQAPDVVVLEGVNHVRSVELHSPVRRTKVAPKASLDTLRIPLRPSESELVPLTTARDLLPSSRVTHRLTLTYKLSLAEGGKITPLIPALKGRVYDGALEGQIYGVFDANKCLLQFGDVYPKPVQVPKGEYVIRVALRHDSVEVLEKLRDLPLRVDKQLDSNISVPVYSTLVAATTQGSTASDRNLRMSERDKVYVGPVPEDKLPKDAKPGCSLSGCLKLAKCSATSSDDVAPDQPDLIYVVPPAKIAPKDDKDDDKDVKSVAERLKEGLRDAQIKLLKELKLGDAADREAYESLRQELLAAWPKHLPLLVERLLRLAALPKDERAAALPDIVAAADEVIAAVDETAVACFIALKNPPEGQKGATYKAEMEAQKSALIDALHKKSQALHDILVNKGPDDSEAAAAFEASFQALRKWVDTETADYVALHALREERAGRLGSAVKALDKVISSRDKLPSKEVLKQKSELLEKLGWTHWATLLDSSINRRFPTSYPPGL